MANKVLKKKLQTDEPAQAPQPLNLSLSILMIFRIIPESLLHWLYKYMVLHDESFGKRFLLF